MLAVVVRESALGADYLPIALAARSKKKKVRQHVQIFKMHRSLASSCNTPFASEARGSAKSKGTIGSLGDP